MRALVLAVLSSAFACGAYAQMSMYTSSNGGTSSAAHATVAAVGLGHKFFSAICTGTSTYPGGYCMVLDAASQPADGAISGCQSTVAGSPCVKFCAAIPAGPAASQGIAVAGGDMSPSFNNGIVVVMSGAANCGTVTTTDGLSVFQSVTYN